MVLKLLIKIKLGSMTEDKIDLNVFLEEMIVSINKKFEEQDERIRKLQRKIELLKKELKSKRELQIDKSVLRVLKGK